MKPSATEAASTPVADESPARAGLTADALLDGPFVLWLVFGLFALVLLRTAWLTEDAFVTFRVVENLLNGHGLTWNPGERVQTYTHPLWLAVVLLTRSLTGEFYFGVLSAAGLCSLAAVWLVGFKLASSRAAALLGLVALGLSRAFVDYSTSGLENPLSHLLFGLFFWLYIRRPLSLASLRLLCLVAALAAINRLDTTLVYLPALAWVFWQLRGWSAVKAALLGGAPILIWQVFSILYYGFPFPNTYYAKLHTGISGSAMAFQGFCYLLNALRWDPLSVLLIGIGLAVPLALRSQRHVPLCLGVLAYLGYVVSVGGDFMSGRFLSLPVFAAVLLWVSSGRFSARTHVQALLLVLALGFVPKNPTVTSDGDFEPYNKEHKYVDDKGISDERAYYYETAGLLKVRRNEDEPWETWQQQYGRELRDAQRKVVVCGAIGLVGYHAGPSVHIIDPHALSDPLLARLPVVAFDPVLQLRDKHLGRQNWRVGHFRRHLPEGYEQTVRTGEDHFKDRNLFKYYKALQLIVSGPIFDGERLTTLARLNLGLLDELVDPLRYRFPGAVTVELGRLAQPQKKGTLWNAPGNLIMGPHGAIVRLGRPRRAEFVEISLDTNDLYHLYFVRGSRVLAERHVPGHEKKRGLYIHNFPVPRAAYREGYDRIAIVPIKGDFLYAVGHMHLLRTEKGVGLRPTGDARGATDGGARTR